MAENAGSLFYIQKGEMDLPESFFTDHEYRKTDYEQLW